MIVCPKCGEENENRAKFCPECGTRLQSRPAPSQEARKTVTILFSDLVGSTALGEHLDSEALREVLDRYFTEMVTAGDDGLVRLWEAATGELLRVLGRSREPFTDTAFSRDGKLVATAGADGTATLYSCEICGSVTKLITTARARTIRELTPAERVKYLHEPATIGS